MTVWGHLLSTWRTSFNISCKSGLTATYSPSFWLCENVFISSSFLKNSFIEYRILYWQFFSFSTLNMFSHCHLHCFWWEVIYYSYWGSLVSGFSCLMLLSKVSLCLWVLAFLLWYVCWFLLVYPNWGSLRFLRCVDNVSHQIWDVYSHYLLE